MEKEKHKTILLSIKTGNPSPNCYSAPHFIWKLLSPKAGKIFKRSGKHGQSMEVPLQKFCLNKEVKLSIMYRNTKALSWASAEDLPHNTLGAVGDCWNCSQTGSNYAWAGSVPTKLITRREALARCFLGEVLTFLPISYPHFHPATLAASQGGFTNYRGSVQTPLYLVNSY